MNPVFVLLVVLIAVVLWLFLGAAFFTGEMFFDIYKKWKDKNEE